MAGLGPPEAQVMLIGKYCYCYRIRTHKRQIRRPGSHGLAGLLKGLAVPRLWPSSLMCMMSQTKGRPHSEAKDGHSLVCVCALRVDALKGVAHVYLLPRRKCLSLTKP